MTGTITGAGNVVNRIVRGILLRPGALPGRLRFRRLLLIPTLVIVLLAGLWLFGRLFILAYGPLPDLEVTALCSDSDWDQQHYRKENLFDSGPFVGRVGQPWSSMEQPLPHFIFMEFDRDYKISSMQIYNRMETRLDVISVRVGDAGGEHVIFEKGDLKDLNPIEVRLGETPIRSIRITILANTINGRLRESADIGEIVFPGFHVKLLQSKV